MDRPFLIQDDDISVPVRVCTLDLVSVGDTGVSAVFKTAN